MKYFYCDSCTLITAYQKNYFDLFSQYKNLLFISKSQFTDELYKPEDIKEKIIKSITIIFENETIKAKTIELKNKHIGLSYYDCLALSFAIIDGYVLVTDDKPLKNAGLRYNVQCIGCFELVEILKKGGKPM